MTTAPAFTVDRCSSCSAPIIWAVTEKLHRMPVDADPHAGANLELAARDGLPPLVKVLPNHLAFGRTDLHRSHFVTCPNAAKHRRRR